MTNCDFNSDADNTADVAELMQEDAAAMGRFRIGNREIREEIIAELLQKNIQHQVNPDNSISYLLSDGEQIDKIGNDAILGYIRRN